MKPPKPPESLFDVLPPPQPDAIPVKRLRYFRRPYDVLTDIDNVAHYVFCHHCSTDEEREAAGRVLANGFANSGIALFLCIWAVLDLRRRGACVDECVLWSAEALWDFVLSLHPDELPLGNGTVTVLKERPHDPYWQPEPWRGVDPEWEDE